MSKGLATVVIGLALALVCVAAWLNWAGLKYQPNMLTAAADAATALFVIALFLERSMAVVNNLIFGEQERTIDAAIVAGDDAAPGAQAALQASKERLRLALGFLIAVALSAAGARTLNALFAGPAGAGAQAWTFDALDILITAGLLAGGNNLLAAILQALKDQGKLTTARVRAELRALASAPALVSPAARSSSPRPRLTR